MPKFRKFKKKHIVVKKRLRLGNSNTKHPLTEAAETLHTVANTKKQQAARQIR